MVDFPMTELFDDSLCLVWLERHLHPDGFACPYCGSADCRLCRIQGHYDAYRCRACDGYYTRFSATAFEASRQRPATLLLLLRGVVKGESTARLARELQLSRQTVHTLRQRLQTNVNNTAPTGVMGGQTFEVDELYQNAGGKVRPIPTSTICHAGGPGTHWVKQPRHGTYDNDRPPIIHVISRETGEERCWVVGHSDKATARVFWAKPCRVMQRWSIPMSTVATMGWISRMPQSITLRTSGHAMTIGMACGKCTTTPVKGPARGCAPSYGRSAACIKPLSPPVCGDQTGARQCQASLTSLDLSDVLANERAAARVPDMSRVAYAEASSLVDHFREECYAQQ
jgi:transposase-like protein